MRIESAKLIIIAVEVSLLLVVLSILVYDELTNVKYAPIVSVLQGKVRGIVQEVDPGVFVYTYLGIRFGRAERFRKPFPAEEWIGIYQATTSRDACPFNGLDNKEKRYLTDTYSEDCLFLNVWRPISEKINRPVMVYIFGGGFKTGSIFKFTHDARYISGRGDVIVVSIQYRLNAFGFLYTGTEDAPGNQGLHDVILGLKWVQHNIRAFGGDPSQVTIFGNSAGSQAVGTLVLSPLTQGLFRKAILQSGTPTSNINQTQSLEATRKISYQLNCPTDDMKITLRCIKSKSVEELLNATQGAGEPFSAMYGDFFSLMPQRAVELLNTGQFFSDIDLMFGTVKDEGPSFVVDDLPELKQPNLTFTTETAKQTIVKLFQQNGFTLPEANDVAQLYLANVTNPSRDELRNIIGTSYGDYFMTCPVILFGEQFARIAPQNKYYAWRLMRRAGIHVADDLFYLFSIPDQSTPEEKQLSHDMIAAWASFASGGPIKMGQVEWTEAFDRSKNSTATSYMSLDPANYTMVHNFYTKTCDDFWRPKIFV